MGEATHLVRNKTLAFSRLCHKSRNIRIFFRPASKWLLSTKASLAGYLCSPRGPLPGVYRHQERENDGAHQPGHYCLIDASPEREAGTRDAVIDFSPPPPAIALASTNEINRRKSPAGLRDAVPAPAKCGRACSILPVCSARDREIKGHI